MAWGRDKGTSPANRDRYAEPLAAAAPCLETPSPRSQCRRRVMATFAGGGERRRRVWWGRRAALPSAALAAAFFLIHAASVLHSSR